MPFTKNVAFSNFPIKMVDATDFNTPETGVVATVQISQDGGAFVNCVNTPATEISHGWYKIDLTAVEMDADVIILKCTAAGCAQNDYIIFTE